jgi:hypothetical protein
VTEKMYLLYIFPPELHTHWQLRCSNFFNPSKKNSFGCAANRKTGSKKCKRLISTPNETTVIDSARSKNTNVILTTQKRNAIFEYPVALIYTKYIKIYNKWNRAVLNILWRVSVVPLINVCSWTFISIYWITPNTGNDTWLPRIQDCRSCNIQPMITQ